RAELGVGDREHDARVDAPRVGDEAGAERADERAQAGDAMFERDVDQRISCVESWPAMTPGRTPVIGVPASGITASESEAPGAAWAGGGGSGRGQRSAAARRRAWPRPRGSRPG